MYFFYKITCDFEGKVSILGNMLIHFPDESYIRSIPVPSVTGEPKIRQGDSEELHLCQN